MEDSFFLPGEDCEPAYLNVRDLPHNSSYRDFVEDLWLRYQPSHDVHFLKDAKKNFQQRFWEMYLFAALQDLGMSPKKGGKKGPDFSVRLNGHRYWIEAVAPRAGEGPDQVPPVVYGECRRSPLDEIQLRYANAVSEKIKKWPHWVEEGIVTPEEGFVIALNGRGCNDFHDGYPPLFVRACVGIGNLAMSLDPTTGKAAEAYYLFNDSIQKKSGECVSTAVFLDERHSCVSGVLHSLAYCARRPVSLLEGVDFLHNPFADVPLPDDAIQTVRRFDFADSQLSVKNPSPPWPDWGATE